jgi:hypothetical protein
MSRRLIAAVSGLGLIAAGALLAVPASAEIAPDGTAQMRNSDSAVTKSGEGEFKDLKVTVSQTTGLVNQVIRISWKDGRPTKPDVGDLGVNYLQIMQCWGGTKEDGPSREQCQYGAQRAWNGGQNTHSRQLSTAGFVDPLEEDNPAWVVDGLTYVPFRSWTGKTTVGPKSEFFDRYTSNEVNHARIRPDGTGEEYFELQTGVESPGLGCGQVRDGDSPLCWLVVVPRGKYEVDGTERGLTRGEPLQTSPLSLTNWQHRIVFPLDFQPIGTSCPIGRDEVPLLGTDRVAEAITRWQPSLCATGDGNFSFTVLGDEAARMKSQSASPDMTFVEQGIPDDLVSPQYPVVYAPVALSGLAISFNLESQSSTLASEDVQRRNGQRLSGIKLNQRLVAKLLTQTYRLDASPDPKRVEGNPWDLAQDPEFLELNPQFKELRFPALGHILVQAGESDSARLVWEWIWADKDARAFLEGEKDPWGTKVNPRYRGTSFPRSDYPRADNVCVEFADRLVPFCTFDTFPYAADLYQAARAASRGDSLATGIYDPTAVPPGNKRTPPQEPGARAIIAITDSALTGRFALNAALLRNAAGEYVAPTDVSIQTAADAAVKTKASGVVQPDPGKKVKGAYPLASYTYAMTSPPNLTKEAAAEYARFLRYATGEGQVLGESPGQLPPGYVPLPVSARETTEKVATLIVEEAGNPVKIDEEGTSTDTSTDSGTSTDTSTDSGTGTSVTDTTTTDTSYTDTSYTDTTVTDTVVEETVVEETTVEETVVEETVVEESAATEVVAVAPAAAQALTPQNPVGLVRYLAVLLLIAGGAALLIAALLGQRLARSRAGVTSPVAEPRRTS